MTARVSTGSLNVDTGPQSTGALSGQPTTRTPLSALRDEHVTPRGQHQEAKPPLLRHKPLSSYAPHFLSQSHRALHGAEEADEGEQRRKNVQLTFLDTGKVSEGDGRSCREPRTRGTSGCHGVETLWVTVRCSSRARLLGSRHAVERGRLLGPNGRVSASKPALTAAGPQQGERQASGENLPFRTALECASDSKC